MNLGQNIYKTVIDKTHNEKVRYAFVSGDVNKIKKVIEYSKSENINYHGRKISIFNLALLDSLEDGSTSDINISNNGDAKVVFETVLSTIPDFFSLHPDTIIIVGGSDGTKKFEENCKLDCKNKRCANTGICRKKGRRIKLYQGHVNDNYEEYNKDYTFYGVVETPGSDNNKIIPYDVNTEYKYILCKKK